MRGPFCVQAPFGTKPKGRSAMSINISHPTGTCADREPDYRDTWGWDGSLVVRLFSHHMSALVGAAARRGVTPQDVVRALVDEHLMSRDA